MSSQPDLTIAYIDQRPESAARVLAAMDAADAAAFLATIPGRYSVRAVSRMRSWPASQIIKRMEPDVAAAILRDCEYENALAILRLLEQNTRATVMSGLPKRVVRGFTHSLTYQAGTVGAHMSIAVTTLKEDDRLADGLDLVKRTDREHPDVFYVVDQAKKPVGALPVTTLLRHPGRTVIADVMITPVVSLSSRSRLSTIAHLDAWDEFSYLPVVNRNSQVVGLLSRRALRLGIDPLMQDGSRQQASITGSLVEHWFATAAGLAALTFSQGNGTRRKGDAK